MATSETNSRQPLTAASIAPYAALVLSSLAFSTNWIVGRGLSTEVPPTAISFWRWFFAFVPLIPFAIGPVRREWPIIRAQWRILLILAVLGVGLFQVFAYWGLRYTTATNGALLNSAVPVIVIILGALFYSQKMSARIALGVAVSMAGVITIIVRGDPTILLSLEFNRGDLLILGAMIFWALYSIRLKERPAGLSTISFMATTFAIGVALTGVLALIEYGYGLRGRYTPNVWAGLAWIGFGPSLIAYSCWTYGVSRIGAARAGVYAHLIPVFAAILAMIFLSENPQAYHLIGFALVLAGIWLTSRK
jgi:drug/metabolite transporter (DMT)-like permease